MADHFLDCSNVVVEEGVFGYLNLEGDIAKGDTISVEEKSEPVPIKYYKLKNNVNKLEVKIITLGATIISIKYPDKFGCIKDVVLGYCDLKSYLDPTLNPYMGCVLGRCAHRILGGKFKLRNKEFPLTINDSGQHHINGGTNGFGRRVWESEVVRNKHYTYVIMSYTSKDGEEGYPGDVITSVTFILTNENELRIHMSAITSKLTILNLSHGPLFNLAGHDAGEDELRAHNIQMNCNRYLYAENGQITGAKRSVNCTNMDLQTWKSLGDAINQVSPDHGFDHVFCITRPEPVPSKYRAHVSSVWHKKSGRYLELSSNMQCVHLYTGGKLPAGPLESDDMECINVDNYDECDCRTPSQISINQLNYLPGKEGARYRKFTAFSLQPQSYPNAINIPRFPSTELVPGKIYRHSIVYKFGVHIGPY